MNTSSAEYEPRILFVTLSNIGDLIMTTPVLTALHEKYPTAVVDIVADRRSGDLLSACPYLGEIIWKSKRSSWAEKRLFLKAIRRHEYTLAVDLRGPWLAWLARSKSSARKTAREKTMHAVEHHFTAVSAFVDKGNIPWTCLWLSPEALSSADNFLGLNRDTRLLALAPGANWPGKIWSAERYAELIDLLADDFDAVCLLGGKDDMARCSSIANAAALPCVDLSGRTSLMESAACLARGHFFVGNDSGLGHIAAALNVPSLTVFGPGDPQRYRPWGKYADIILAPDCDLANLRAEPVAARVKESIKPR